VPVLVAVVVKLVALEVPAIAAREVVLVDGEGGRHGLERSEGAQGTDGVLVGVVEDGAARLVGGDHLVVPAAEEHERHLAVVVQASGRVEGHGWGGEGARLHLMILLRRRWLVRTATVTGGLLWGAAEQVRHVDAAQAVAGPPPGAPAAGNSSLARSSSAGAAAPARAVRRPGLDNGRGQRRRRRPRAWPSLSGRPRGAGGPPEKSGLR
jgi:hypothetical protein